MAKNEDSNQQDQTRDKILDAAEILFAEGGFDAVSVREITASAGVNLAAVNYHFGSKKELYLDVFRERLFPGPGRRSGRSRNSLRPKNYR